MLQFDAEKARMLDICYAGADVTRRRRANFDQLRPRPGDRIVDIGCGNGLMTLELARAVGTDGQVVGVDPSPDMLASARSRCDGLEQVVLAEGDAHALPLADGTADAAVSIQVMEYVEDVEGALREALRVLRPGGRLVIGDIHFGTFAWHSDDEARMARAIRIWNRHAVHSDLPVALPSLMRKVGFVVDGVTPAPVVDMELRPDGLALMLLKLFEPYLVSQGEFTADEAADWAREQHDLARDGRFFFALTHFVVSARKPDA